MSPPPLTGAHGAGARATLAVLARAGVGVWLSTRDLARECGADTNHIGARLRSSLDRQWVERRLPTQTRAEWSLTPAGKAAWDAAMAVVYGAAAGGKAGRSARRRPQARDRAVTARELYVPTPGSHVARMLAALAKWPAGEWVSSADLAKAAGMPSSAGFGGYLDCALGAGVIEKGFPTSPRRAMWRLVTDVAASQAAADGPDDDDEDDHAEPAPRSSTWEPLPGTVPGRALAWLAGRPIGTWVEAAHLAVAIDADPRCLMQALVPAVRGGLLAQRQSLRDVRAPVYAMYSQVREQMQQQQGAGA